MLKVTIPGGVELFNETASEFFTSKDTTLTLEHSLVSLSKWEEKWETPFLSNPRMTYEQSCDYIRCMTITQNVPPEVYVSIPQSVIDQVSAYIARKMTATTFSNEDESSSKQTITAEVIYHAMTLYNIPFECQKWHLNKLMTLIKICKIKSEPSKPEKLAAKRRAMNQRRRQRLGSRG